MRELSALLRRHAEGLPVYFVGSCLALAIDTLILMASHRQGMPLAWSATLGFLCGMSVNYAISVRYAFRHRCVRDRRLEFATFGLIGVGGLGVTQLLLWAQVTKAGWPVLPAKGMTAVLVFGLNFSMRKQLLFTATTGKGQH